MSVCHLCVVALLAILVIRLAVEPTHAASSVIQSFRSGMDTADNANSLYAISTMVLTSKYLESAMSLCESIRRELNDDLPSDLELVVFVVQPEERQIPVEWLSCCFTRVLELPVLSVSKLPVFDRFKEQYTKLHFWNQTQYNHLLYIDADATVLRVQPLLDILRSPVINFAAVQDWYEGQWAKHWNGGMLLLTPGEGIYKDLQSNVEVYIAQQKYDTNMAEQGYLSAFFAQRGFTLPTSFNFNLAIMTQNPALWDEHVKEAVIIHFTWTKPWLTEDTSHPMSLWKDNLIYARQRCPYP